MISEYLILFIWLHIVKLYVMMNESNAKNVYGWTSA